MEVLEDLFHLVIDKWKNNDSGRQPDEAHCGISDVNDVLVQVLNMIVLHLNATVIHQEGKTVLVA